MVWLLRFRIDSGVDEIELTRLHVQDALKGCDEQYLSS